MKGGRRDYRPQTSQGAGAGRKQLEERHGKELVQQVARYSGSNPGYMNDKDFAAAVRRYKLDKKK